jgi:hypothetical protein
MKAEKKPSSAILSASFVSPIAVKPPAAVPSFLLKMWS